MDPEGRVILLDPVIPEGDTPHSGKFMDITMMALTRVVDRTEVVRSLTRVLKKASLRHTNTIALSAPSSVLVALAA